MPIPYGEDGSIFLNDGVKRLQVREILFPGGTVGINASRVGVVTPGNQTAQYSFTGDVAFPTLKKVGFFGTAPIVKPAVTGSLSTMADAPTKAVMTSLIAQLTALGLITNSTT